MKKIYLINALIPRIEYDKKIKFLLSNNYDFRSKGDNMYGIYAWCDSKEKKEEFLSTRRKDIYNIVTIEFDDKDEFKKFKGEQKNSYLDYRPFDTSSSEGGEIKILTTFNEYIQVTEYGEENLNEFSTSDIDMIEYMIFNDEIVDCLDVIGYTFDYDRNWASGDRQDNAGFQASYNLTPLGRELKYNIKNEVSILLNLFRFFFFE